MNIFLVHLLWTVLLPLLSSAVIYFIIRAFASRQALPIAIGIAYLATYVAVRPGWPSFPPREYRDYIFIMGLVGLIWGIIEADWHKNLIARWTPRIILVFTFLLLLLKNRMKSWSTLEDILWVAGLGIFFLVSWWILESLVKAEKPALPTPAMLIALLIWIGVFSAMSATQGSSSMAQLAGAFAAALGIIMVLSWFLKVELTPYFSTLFIFILGTLLVCAVVFPNPGIPIFAAIFIALSPLLLLAVNTPNNLKGNILRIAVFAVPLVIMAGIFVARFLATYNQPSF
jgi:apolipoprotein N-acyltransferase